MTSANGAKDCLVIFVKNPIPGQVKTRLSPHLTAQGASRIYKAFVQDTLRMASKIPVARRVVAYSGDLTNSNFGEGIPKCFHWISQGEGNLGDRLTRIFQWCLDQGFLRTVFIGSDSPTLPRSYALEAFRLLKESDLVLGPAWDGGYYLIGLKGPVFNNLFKGISWSTPAVLLQTVERAKKLQKKVGMLPPWYDIDKRGDLRFLCLDFFCTPSVKKSSEETYKVVESLRLVKRGRR